MIKFFRKIRQKLLTENKFNRYFIYAIGEILLVVIGILIALQINNWNERQNLSNTELALIEELDDNLKASKKEIQLVIESHKQSIRWHKELIYHINKDLPYSNKLDTIFGNIATWASPYLTLSAFETLKIEGLGIIKSKKIKDWITLVYESDFNYIINDYDRYEWERAKQTTLPFAEKYIRRDLESDLAIPNDFDKLKRNNEFINLLHSNIWLRENGIELYELVIKDIDTLSNHIESELKLRRK